MTTFPILSITSTTILSLTSQPFFTSDSISSSVQSFWVQCKCHFLMCVTHSTYLRWSRPGPRLTVIAHLLVSLQGAAHGCIVYARRAHVSTNRLLAPSSQHFSLQPEWGQLYGLRRWRRWLNIGRPVIFSRDGSREKVHTRCVFESVFCRIVTLTTLARMMASNHLLSSCNMRLRSYHDLSIILSNFVKSLSTFLLK